MTRIACSFILCLSMVFFLGNNSRVAADATCTVQGTIFRVTLTGSGQIEGTPGDDVILGSPGNDQINGRGGADVVCAGSGNDTVTLGPGSVVFPVVPATMCIRGSSRGGPCLRRAG